MSRFQRLVNTMQRRQPFGLTVHIGNPPDKENNYPKAIDYFRFDGMFAERAKTHYPTNPKTLHICFMKQDVEQICMVTQEGSFNGSVVMRATIDWWKQPQVERYEVFNHVTQLWDIVDEAGFAAKEAEFDEKAKKTPKATFLMAFNLRLSFWLQELMAEGIECYCQINTKADDSSIPEILHVLSNAIEARRLHAYPYELSVGFVSGKGFDKNFDMKGRRYPVLSLQMDSTVESLQRQQKAIAGYVNIMQIPPISEQIQQALKGNAAPKNALNAAPEHAEAIDAEHVEVTVAAPDAERLNEIAILVERGNLLIQMSENPQAAAWWDGILATQDLTKLRNAVAGLERKAAEKAALKPTNLEPIQPVAEMREPGQEG